MSIVAQSDAHLRRRVRKPARNLSTQSFVLDLDHLGATLQAAHDSIRNNSSGRPEFGEGLGILATAIYALERLKGLVAGD